jgi:glycine cleavage system H protein
MANDFAIFFICKTGGQSRPRLIIWRFEMETRNDLMYSKTHEWLKVDGPMAYVGITDYAQDAIGEIVFVEMPPVGAVLAAGDSIAAVESVKAASEIYSPVSGKVVRINPDLSDSPELVNQQPYESWIAVLEMSCPGQVQDLMDEAAYLDFCGKEHA